MRGRPQEKEAPESGKALAEARNRKGLTQPELAALTGVSVKTIDYYERRAKSINPAFAEKAAAVLGISPIALGVEPKQEVDLKELSARLEGNYQRVRELPPKRQEFVCEVMEQVIKQHDLEQPTQEHSARRKQGLRQTRDRNRSADRSKGRTR